MRQAVVALAVAALAVVGCAQSYGPSEADLAADRQAIESKTPVWESAFNSGDAAAITALYGEDAILYPPNESPVRGRAAVQEYWQAFIDTGAKAKLGIEEVAVDGDLAYKVGTYEVLGADGTSLDSGHFVELWARRDGAWVFIRDMWNSDRPLAMPSDEP